MSSKHFNTCISPNNKLWKFMSFTKDDKVLRDFVDYVRFHTSRNNKPLLKYINRDNASTLFLNRLNLLTNGWKLGFFRAWIQTVFLWQIVPLCELREVKIKKNVVLMVSMYWKWLKLLRDDYDLWLSLKCFFKEWLELWDELTITRIDYTVDCAKYNFRKENTLNTKKWWNILKENKIQTKYFGVKSHDSAMFIRYYDKKADLLESWFYNLYPEYHFLDEIMRYELVVNSKWLDDYERHINLQSLYDLVNLWYDIPFRNRAKEKKLHRKDDTILNNCVKNINLLKNTWDYESIDKLFIYLDSIYRKNGRSFPLYSPMKWDFDCPVLCETLVHEKPCPNS